MNTTVERLRKFQSATLSRWRENAEARLANQEERRMARKLALQMLDVMEHKGITEVALADSLGVTCAELSPVLKGHQLPSEKLRNGIVTVLGLTN